MQDPLGWKGVHNELTEFGLRCSPLENVQLTGNGDAYVGELEYEGSDHAINAKVINPRVRLPPGFAYF